MRRFGAPMDPAMSIALSDAQIAQILLVSRPLQPKERTAFMAALLEDLLMRRDEIGDGACHWSERTVDGGPAAVDTAATDQAHSRTHAGDAVRTTQA